MIKIYGAFQRFVKVVFIQKKREVLLSSMKLLATLSI